jgi:hypothetical protein
MTSEEVRPCLRCDALASAATFHCPTCGALLGPASAPTRAEAPGKGGGEIAFAEAVVVVSAAAVAAGTAFAFFA